MVSLDYSFTRKAPAEVLVKRKHCAFGPYPKNYTASNLGELEKRLKPYAAKGFQRRQSRLHEYSGLVGPTDTAVSARLAELFEPLEVG